jgi:cbb3-type cytochrome oxidase maturation protein
MSVLLVALPIALALGGLAVYGFVRAVRGGQFDDLDTPALRMLHDDVGDRDVNRRPR